MSPILVGVGGPSSSGKSTVVRILLGLLPNSSVVHLDDFYLPDSQIPVSPEWLVADWDCPEALDWAAFKTHLHSLKGTGPGLETREIQSKEIHSELALLDAEVASLNSVLDALRRQTAQRPLVFVDGFMLYHDQSVADLFDVKLLFRAPYHVLKARREARPGYNTEEGFWQDPPDYFDHIVWPNYVKTHGPLFVDGDCEGELTPAATGAGIVTVDGSSQVVLSVTQALANISAFLGGVNTK